MNRSEKTPESPGLPVGVSGVLRRRASSPGLENPVGLYGTAPSGNAAASARLARFGDLKDNRVNHWAVRDRQVARRDQAVGVEPA